MRRGPTRPGLPYRGTNRTVINVSSLYSVSRAFFLKGVLLCFQQLDWYNMYNERIRNEVGPILQERGYDDAFKWMQSKTKPVTYKYKVNSATSAHGAILIIGICTLLVHML